MSNASAFKLDALDTRIKELVAYARERGGEDRSLLFRNLIDLFLTGKAPQKQPTRQQLIDVIGALIPHVEEESRRTVAELLANMSTPPLDLAVCLAKDDPGIVGPLLKSQAFDEDDIIEIIAHTGRDHHQAIASRNDLSANVWIALARAVPKAASNQQKASLSLWSEGLGARETTQHQKATVTQLHPEQPVDNTDEDYSSTWQLPTEPATKTDVGINGDRKLNTENQTANQSQPHYKNEIGEPGSRQAASLRILRTNKDLISERIETASDASLGMATDRDYIGKTQAQSSTPHTHIEPEHEKHQNDTDNENCWTWQSDRDGIVTAVSENFAHYFPHNRQVVGLSILDMLSLNTKLGHPVSRAFQRRSAIHSAPINLENAGGNNRWTLDAKPLFSAGSGTFDGYQGWMTFVPLDDKGKYELEHMDTGASTVFLDEQNDHAHNKISHTTITDEKIDRTRTPAPAAEASSTKENTAPHINAAAESLMAETAANAVKDVLAETLSSMLQSTQPKQSSQTNEAEPTSEIAATLHLLEEAIIKLAETKSAGGAAPARLQAEIAAACLRSLKEQLDIDHD